VLILDLLVFLLCHAAREEVIRRCENKHAKTIIFLQINGEEDKFSTIEVLKIAKKNFSILSQTLKKPQ